MPFTVNVPPFDLVQAFVGQLRDDLRFALRRLGRQPAFTLTAVLTLALGLGANVAVFTLGRALMARTLPVPRPADLYRLGDDDNCCVNTGLQRDYSLFSYRLYAYLRDHTPEFAALAGFQARPQPLGVRRSGDAVAVSLVGQFVSGNYFTTFGVHAAAGRLLEPGDDRRGAAPVAVLSYRAWTGKFGRDPGIIGAPVAVNGLPMTVVGVTGRPFFGDTVRPDPPGIWIPLGQEPAMRGQGSLLDRPEEDWLYAIGRLAPGVPPATLGVHVSASLRQWLAAQTFIGDTHRASIAEQRIRIAPAGGGVQLMRLAFGQSFTLLVVTSALVLLIASANLANLLLARTDRGQAAIRAALGASSARLMRQALTEGVLLALIGGLAGVAVAMWGARALVALAFRPGVFLPVDLSPSPVVLLFTLGLALATGALFTAAPAWAMSREAPSSALHGVGRSGQARSFVPRRSLVVVQVALSAVLLTGAGLLVRSLGNLEGQPLGFEPDQRVVARIDPPPLADDPGRLAAFYQTARERLLQIPGVVNASFALYSPMEGNNWSSGISIDGLPSDPNRPGGSSWNRVGPRYFETVGTRVLRGRAIDARDTPAAAHVAVVNEAFVRRFFTTADPIGRRLGIGGASQARDYEIVGVVEDVKYTSADEPVRPMIFLPAMQLASYADVSRRNVQARSTLLRSLVVETAPGTGAIDGPLRRALAGVNPDVTVIRVMPLSAQVDDNFRFSRLLARLTSLYGLLALALASLGLYGVTAYSVARRTREIGVRAALGADPARIMRTVMAGPLVQTLVGLAIGLPLALAGGQAIASLLYGVEADNPWIAGTVALVLVASGALAAMVPARRAARLDPTRALRAD